MAIYFEDEIKYKVFRNFSTGFMMIPDTERFLTSITFIIQFPASAGGGAIGLGDSP